VTQQHALGAEEVSRFPAPDGSSIWHAELRIGDSIIFVNDEMPDVHLAPTADAPAPVTMWLYVRDCDAAFNRAVAAGAKPTMPPADMFWGDRVASIADPYGYLWSFATHQKDLTAEEMRRDGEEFARSMAARR
jgi:PhnB protein